MKQHNIKVFVFTHFLDQLAFPSVFRDSNIYYGIDCSKKHNLIATYHDNIGENIAKYNPYINEMTAIWWIGKHIKALIQPNYEFIGTMHYRRYMPFKMHQLQKNSIICSPQLRTKTILETFYGFHNKYVTINDFIDSLPADLTPSKQDIWKHLVFDKLMYECNCFIMHKNCFEEYFMFIDKCITVAINKINQYKKQLNTLSAYQSRFYGFILERLTSAFIKYQQQKNNMTIIESKLVQFNIANKINGAF